MANEDQGSIEDQILKDLDAMGGDESDGQAEDSGDGPIVVRISKDKMKAYVKVLPPLDSGHETDKSHVTEELIKANVSFGIDEEAIDEIFTYGTYNVEVVVAKGKQPSNGQSARIDYKFETSEDKKVKLEQDEHGNVDHRKVNLIASVEPGTLLAVKIPAVPGETGTTVTGRELPAMEGKDIALPLGENVKAMENDTCVVSEIAGQPVLRNERISVSAVYEVKGDVSYKTGNIDFNGTVVVTGNVMSDFEVHATQDIEVHGNIEKAILSAGGDIRVKGGMYGANAGKLVAKGDVTIRSIDAGIIDAAGNITLEQQARQSTLMAGVDIILNNQKGSIVGGKATAAHHFIVSNLGSTSFTETLIEIGLNPKIKMAYTEVEKNVAEHRNQLEKITLHIKTIKQRGKEKGAFSDKEKALMGKLVPTYHNLKAVLEIDLKKLKYLQEKLSKLKGGKARVKGTAYPGVKIFGMNANLTIKKEINFSSFSEQNEQITVGPY